MKLTLERKILAGFIICSLFLLALVFISFRNSRNLAGSNQWVIHTQETLNAWKDILVDELDAETNKRGFVITGDAAYLDPFHRAMERVSRSIDRAKALTKDNPAQQANIARIQTLTDTLTRFLTACIRLRQEQGFEQARIKVATGEGKRLLDNIRTVVEDATAVEQTLLAERKQATAEDARDFTIVFIVLLSAIALILVGVYLVITANLRALKKAEQETAQKNWTLTGSGHLIKAMQGNKQLTELAQTIIRHLAEWLDAQAGALYVAEEDSVHLKLTGAYALSGPDAAPPVITLGQGLAGQSAVEKRPLLVTDIPAGHFSTGTSFGDLLPRQIMAVPVIFEGSLIAVIELGGLRPFSPLQQDYLQAVVDNIAVALSSAQARERAAELLDETQRQAEELEAQQEELKQTNEELHEKTELLERSEAELKAQQEELQQTNEELGEKAGLLKDQKEMLEAAKTDLETKAAELEQTTRYKSEFLANMSHELRTPLNSILILSQMLMENKNKVLGEKEVTYAKNVNSAGNDLLRLINDILDLSKVEAGKMELDIARVDLGEIAGNLRVIFSEIANERGIDFTIVFPEDNFTQPLYSDSQRLEQILRNFLSNAFKFTGKQGKVTLEMDTTPAGEAVFTVTDTGIGIPQSKQAVIFEAFQQADGSTKRKYGGTGLGLSISLELAHTLGGGIRLHSEEGKGSRFTLYLPLTAVVAAAPDKPSEHRRALQAKNSGAPVNPVGAKKGKQLLVVEDNREQNNAIRDLIGNGDVQSFSAYAGSDAFELMQKQEFDCIIIDLGLPDMSGFELLEKIRADSRLNRIPVIVYTGRDLTREETARLNRLANTVVLKTANSRERLLDEANLILHRAASNAPEEKQPYIPKLHRSDTVLKHRKVLIVDDDMRNIYSLTNALEEEGLRCLTAENGKDAIRLLKEHRDTEMILMDVMMPEMDGYEATREIRNMAEFAKLPVIALTAKAMKGDREKCLEAGMSDYIAKPVNIDQLLSLMRVWLYR